MIALLNRSAACQSATRRRKFSPGQGTTTVPQARTTTTGSGSTSAADADRSGAARQSTRAVNSTSRDRVPTLTHLGCRSRTSPARTGASKATDAYPATSPSSPSVRMHSSVATCRASPARRRRRRASRRNGHARRARTGDSSAGGAGGPVGVLALGQRVADRAGRGLRGQLAQVGVLPRAERVPDRQGDAVPQADLLADRIDDGVHPGLRAGGLTGREAGRVGTAQAGQPQSGPLHRHGRMGAGPSRSPARPPARPTAAPRPRPAGRGSACLASPRSVPAPPTDRPSSLTARSRS